LKTIVTVTPNPTIDISTSVEQVVSNRKLRCESPLYRPGGGGINVSRAMKRLGGDSLTLYPVGGANGDILKHLLDEEGIQQQPVPVKGPIRENLIIGEKLSGDHYHFIMPGPQFEESEWNRCLEELSSIEPKPDYIVGSGSLAPGVPEDFYARVAEIASELEARFIINTSGEALSLAVRSGVYLLKLTMQTLQELTGEEIEDEEAQEHVAKQLIETEQSEIVVVSLGKAGALIASQQGIDRLRAPSIPEKSDVGAGDSMVAGIVLKLAEDESLRKAVSFGLAARTATVMTPGAELCHLEDVEELYDKMIQEESGVHELKLPDTSDIPNIRR
jgi:6-phosphofructokinase 2